MKPRFHIAFSLMTLALSTGTGCDIPSEPDPIAVSMRPVVLETEQEYVSWPSNPTVSGGEAIAIRGYALAGCGALVADAGRSDDTIEFRLRSVGDQNPCPLSKPAWEPFSATIEALPPGEYRIRIMVVGHGRKVFSGIRIDAAR